MDGHTRSRVGSRVRLGHCVRCTLHLDLAITITSEISKGNMKYEEIGAIIVIATVME